MVCIRPERMFRQVTMAFGSEVLFIVICLNKEDFRMKNNLYSSSQRRTPWDPQVCISAAADESGEILFLISGYGAESSAKYQLHIDRYDQRCRIISDGSSSIRKFCKDNHFRCTALTEGYHKTKEGKHISDVNSLHSDLKDLIRKKRNVSIRHLQGYLN